MNIFVLFYENIHCGYSLGESTYLQHNDIMFLLRNKKTYQDFLREKKNKTNAKSRAT